MSAPGRSRAATTLGSLGAVIEAVGACTLVHAGGPVLLANRAMQRLLGYTQAELSTMPFESLVSADRRAALHEHGQRCLHSDDELPVLEVDVETASGATRALELNLKALVHDGQRLVVVTAQDLSDMRHVQNSLMQVGRLMHQIVENAPVATFVIDTEHRVTHWNAACTALTGLAAADVLGRQDAWRAFADAPRPLMADLIVDGTIARDGPAQYGDRLRASATVPDAYEHEAFFPRLGGEGRWLYFNAAPLRDMEGRVIGAIETLLDVTPRHAAEDALRHHRNELEQMVVARTAELLTTHHDLEAFIENAPVAIATTEGDEVVRCNRTFCEMFGLPEGGAIGRPTRSFFASDEAFAELRRMATPRLSRGEPFSHEMHMRTEGGESIWVQMIAYAGDATVSRARFWWLLQDRSEVMRAQQELVDNFRRLKETNARLAEAQNQLLQSEKMASIGQLAAGVAHEINNPIGFVSSNFGTLRRYADGLLALVTAYRGLETPEQAADAVLQQAKERAELEYVVDDLPVLLDESDDGLRRVKRIVQDLKDFSRVDQADWQEADLNAGLESTLNVVKNEVKYKAEVRREYGTLPPVLCLAAQLNQVFMNLIVNAAHAIEGWGVITLRSGVDGPWAWVSVTDTGKGMSPDVLRRIFEPFFTTKPVGQGTGLGLSLSFSIVQKHGGHIDVHSEVGHGTCFTVRVPVAGPPKAPVAASPKALPSSQPSPVASTPATPPAPAAAGSAAPRQPTPVTHAHH